MVELIDNIHEHVRFSSGSCSLYFICGGAATAWWQVELHIIFIYTLQIKIKNIFINIIFKKKNGFPQT